MSLKLKEWIFKRYFEKEIRDIAREMYLETAEKNRADCYNKLVSSKTFSIDTSELAEPCRVSIDYSEFLSSLLIDPAAYYPLIVPPNELLRKYIKRQAV